MSKGETKEECIKRIMKWQEENLENRPFHLWVGRSSENGDAAQLLFDAYFPFVAIPAGGMTKPELKFGPYEYRGIEEIRGFIKLWAEIRVEEEKNEGKEKW